MKTRLPKSITTIPQAESLLRRLWKNGESFHPEDDANDLHGDPFTKAEGDKLNKLMADIYALPGNDNHQNMAFDPCGYLLELDKQDKKFFWQDLSGRGFTATFTWDDIKRIYETQYKADWDELLKEMGVGERRMKHGYSLYDWAWSAEAGDEWRSDDGTNKYTCTKS